MFHGLADNGSNHQPVRGPRTEADKYPLDR
jgi:hypothetical protein